MRIFVIAGFALVCVACTSAPGTRPPGASASQVAGASPATSVVPLSEREAALREIESWPAPQQMRSALMAVANAQEQYFGRHRRFTDDISALREMPGCTIGRQVEVTVVSHSAGGWAGRSRHPSLPGRSCVQLVARPGAAVAVPTTDRENRRGDEQPGAVICDSLPKAGN